MILNLAKRIAAALAIANVEVARVFPEQPNRQKCADLADNSASRSHVSTSLFFSPTRLTRHFRLSNLKIVLHIAPVQQHKGEMCIEELQKQVDVDMWSKNEYM